MTNALDDLPEPPPARRRLDVNIARPARRRRPAEVNVLYVLLVEWALQNGVVDVLASGRPRWTHAFGPTSTITADEREFQVWLNGDLAARVTATDERWFTSFDHAPTRDLLVTVLRNETRGTARPLEETDG